MTPYIIGYWANTRSAIVRTDAYRGGTIARLQGLSIGIVSNNRVRAVTTISYCAIDMLSKLNIDRYFGHKRNLTMNGPTGYRSTNTPFYRHQSIPIG